MKKIHKSQKSRGHRSAKPRSKESLRIDWKLYASIESGPLKKKILMLIYNSIYPVSSIEITKYFGRDASQMYAMLREFEGANIVNEISGRKRNRIYEITKKGKEMIEILLEKEKYIRGSKNKSLK